METISQRLQDAFVILAITDDQFLKICRHSVKINYFFSPIVQSIVKLCYTYFDHFKEAPKQHFQDELARFLAEKEEDSVIDEYLTYIQKLNEVELPAKGYILSRFNQFIRSSELKQAAIQFAKLVASDELDKAQNIMMQALKSGIYTEEIGVVYPNENPTYYVKDHAEKILSSGWPSLDVFLRRGLCRTDLICILGGAKGKKSWSMVHLGKLALTNGLKVLHITQELSAEDTEQRYDRAIGCLVREKEPQVITFKYFDEQRNRTINQQILCQSVWNKEEVLKCRKTIERLGGKLIIKKYPIGTCTVEEIERYLDYLETFEGFIPDVVINDYPEKMKLPIGEHRRDGIHNVYINMKRIAEERQQLWLTVSQVPRYALRKSLLDKDDFAEDIRKLEDVDLVIAISHNRTQAQMNQMQAFVLANRHGLDTFGCHYTFQLDAGQLVVSSWTMKPEEEEEETEEIENE